ncbi:MAG: hypothetical protein K2L96_03325 [Muribaculaceae bacterium]|nr:hypothetical protein [Muribaculaceae bacterium]
MDELKEYFKELLRQAGSIDMAEADFRQAMVDDPELKHRYKEYCHEIGTSEKHGFRDFCEEYEDERNDVWQNLNDYDE